MLTSSWNQRFTSRSKSPVVIIKSQQRKNIKELGIKPATEQSMGTPNMPAPMQHPAIIKILPATRPVKLERVLSMAKWYHFRGFQARKPC